MKIKNLTLAATLLFLLSTVSFAQTPLYPSTYHIGGISGSVPALPAASTMAKKVVNVDNGADGTDCTVGGGTSNHACRSDGSVWSAWGDGNVIGSGVVASVSGAPPINSTGGTAPTISIDNAAADGSTKGAASFTAADFNSSSGNIAIDYTNGQAASASLKGFLTSTDWNTFNGKESVLSFSTGLNRTVNTITVDQSFAPTWTGNHRWNSYLGIQTAPESGHSVTAAFLKIAKSGLDLSTDAPNGIYINLDGGNTPAGEHLTGIFSVVIASSNSPNTGGPISYNGISRVNAGVTTTLALGAGLLTDVQGSTGTAYGQFNQVLVGASGAITGQSYGEYIDTITQGPVANATGVRILIRKVSSGSYTTAVKGLDLSGWSGSPTTSYGIYADTGIDIGSTKYFIYSLSASPSVLVGSLTASNISGTNTGDQTITLTGDVTGSGTSSFATTIGALKVTNAMLAGSIAASKLVGTDIATVGTVTAGTWQATPVALAYGGTNANLTASNGGIFYSTGSAGAILAGAASAGQILRSGASAAPTWSTATYPATAGTAANVLRSDGTNFLSAALAAADLSNGVTGSGAVVLANTPTLITPVLGVATANSINKVALTAPATSATLTIANGKTLTVNNSIAFTGTDSTVMTFPTTTATIARTDASQTFTGIQTFSGDVQLSGSTANLFMKDSSTGWLVSSTTVINPQASNSIRSTSYTSGLVGWSINATGSAEFDNIDVRGAIHAGIFTYNSINVTAGSQIVTPSGAKLKSDVTVTAAPTYGTTTFTIDAVDQDGLSHAASQLFVVNDILRLKDGLVGDTWFKVTAVSDQTTFWRYTASIQAGSANVTYRAGLGIPDYGVSGKGNILLTADQTNSPYMQMATHAATFSSADASGSLIQTLQLRLGNLNGSYGFSSDLYGLGAGQYGTASKTWFTIEQTNGLRFGNNTTILTQLDTSGVLTLGQVASGKSNTLISAGALSIRLNTTGLFGVDTSGNVRVGTDISAAATTNLFVSNASQTYNSEAGYVAGDILIGDNTSASNFGNIKITGGAIKFRRGVTDYIAISSTDAQFTNLIKMSGANAAISLGSTPPTSSGAGTGIWLDRTGLFGLFAGSQYFTLSASTGKITAQFTTLNASATMGTSTSDAILLDGSVNIIGATHPTTQYSQSIRQKAGWTGIGASEYGTVEFWQYIRPNGTGSPSHSQNQWVLAYSSVDSSPGGTTVTGEMSLTATGNLAVAGSVAGASGLFSLTDAGTAAFSDVVSIYHTSSGTAAANFGASIYFSLESSTTNFQDAGRIGYLWTTATQASRTSAFVIQTVNSAGALAEVARFAGNGDATFTGLLKVGSGPTTHTDAAGKILSAALNTVGVAQGGTGLATLTSNAIYKGNGTSAMAVGIMVDNGSNVVLNGSYTSALDPGGLHVKAGTPGISIEDTAGSGNHRNFAFLNNYFNTGLMVWTYSTTAGGSPTSAGISIDAVNARVGILTSAPSVAFEVNGSAQINGVLTAGSSPTTLTSSTGTILMSALGTGGTPRFAGIGIGTAYDSSKADVLVAQGSGSLPGLSVTSGQTSRTILGINNTTGKDWWIMSEGSSGNPANGLRIYNNTNGVDAVKLTSAGAVQFPAYGAGTLVTDASGNITALTNLRLKGYTVATLPAGTQGDTAFVTDLLAPGFLMVAVGGGTVVGPVFFNGTAWVSY